MCTCTLRNAYKHYIYNFIYYDYCQHYCQKCMCKRCLTCQTCLTIQELIKKWIYKPNNFFFMPHEQKFFFIPANTAFEVEVVNRIIQDMDKK